MRVLARRWSADLFSTGLMLLVVTTLGCSAPEGGGGSGGGVQCVDDAACNDGDPCTADGCVNGTCLNVPVDGCGASPEELREDLENAFDETMAAVDGGDVEAAADAIDVAIASAFTGDPDGARELVQDTLAARIRTVEDVQTLYDLEQALAGREVWLAAPGTAEKSALAAQGAQWKRALVIFVNGVWTGYAAANSDIQGLMALLTSEPKGIPQLTGIGLHYNLSATDEEKSFWGQIVCPLTGLLWSLLDKTGASCHDHGKTVDLMEASADKVVEWLGNPDVGIDHDDIADRVERELDGGLAVILIGHSQGNWKIARALNLLWDRYDQETIKAHVGVVATGCPANYQQAIDRGISVRKFNIRRSASVATTVWEALTETIFRLVGQERVADEDIVSLLDTTQPEDEWLENKWGTMFPDVHDFYSSYLGQYGVEIREHIRDLVGQITVSDADDGGIPGDDTTEPVSADCAVLDGNWVLMQDYCADLPDDPCPSFNGVYGFDSGVLRTLHIGVVDTIIVDGTEHVGTDSSGVEWTYEIEGGCTGEGDSMAVAWGGTMESDDGQFEVDFSFEVDSVSSDRVDGQALMVANDESGDWVPGYFVPGRTGGMGSCAGSYVGTFTGWGGGVISAAVLDDGTFIGEFTFEGDEDSFPFFGAIFDDDTVVGSSGTSGQFDFAACVASGEWSGGEFEAQKQ